MQRSLNNTPHYKRNLKTTPIRSELCQKEYSSNTKNAISGSNYNPPGTLMTGNQSQPKGKVYTKAPNRKRGTTMLTKREKNLLKKLAHKLKPLIQIGKNGVTPGTISNIDKALKDHELIKIKYLEHKAEKNTLTRQIIEETGSDLINKIGNTITLYRESPNPEKKEINLSRKQITRQR